MIFRLPKAIATFIRLQKKPSFTSYYLLTFRCDDTVPKEVLTSSEHAGRICIGRIRNQPNDGLELNRIEPTYLPTYLTTKNTVVSSTYIWTLEWILLGRSVKQGQYEAQDRPLWNPRCHHQGPHTVFSQLRRIQSTQVSCPEYHVLEVCKEALLKVMLKPSKVLH